MAVNMPYGLYMYSAYIYIYTWFMHALIWFSMAIGYTKLQIEIMNSMSVNVWWLNEFRIKTNGCHWARH
jgi:hypothetical protein